MLIDKFLQYIKYEKCYSEHTYESYKTDLLQFKDFVESKGAKEFDPVKIETKDVREWIVFLMKQKEKASSVGRKISALKSFYKYLRKSSYVEKDPMRQVVIPKREKRLPTFVRETEMHQLLDEMVDVFEDDYEGVRDKLVIETFYTLGIRLSELIGMKDVDVDRGNKTVKVTGKGNKQRIIPFGDRLLQSMESYLQLREATTGVRNGYFFQKEDGSAMYPVLVYRIVRKYLMKVSSQKKKSPHVLRHTFATAMLNNGAEINAVKELLGHANLAATEVYTHTTFEQLQKIYKQAHPRA